jgi:hypothetical protein
MLGKQKEGMMKPTTNDARVAMIAMSLREAQLQRPVDAERINMLMLANWVLKQPIIKEWRSTTRNKDVKYMLGNRSGVSRSSNA